MANQFKTNLKTDLVALRFAEGAKYLTAGSKKYFKDQLKGKRNGTTYRFVIRDAGEYQTGISLDHASDLVERFVDKSMHYGNVVIDTNIVQKITDVDWDREVAIPNGKKLVNGTVADAIKADLGLQNTAFIGAGWMPLTKATGFLRSISSEARYGFVDPMVDSILAAAGKSWETVNAEPIDSEGLLGKWNGTQFYDTQFLPSVEISEALATELASATVTSYASGEEYDTLTLSGVTQTIPAGTPIFVDGIYACDLVGDKTSAKKAFIAIEDAASGAVKVAKNFDNISRGTRGLCKADGSDVATSDFNGAKIKGPEAGEYFLGIVRLDGAMEFDVLDELDTSNADTKYGKNEGITVVEQRAIDVMAGSNKTRWTVASVSGIVEPRAVSLVLIKDQNPNLVVC
ncbi:MAG: hypothetical protein KIH02_08075 [Parabacteroides sp.]|nr:hypothetical protein [Parabacteroides sp.]